MQTISRDNRRTKMPATSKLSSGPLARNYCLALSTTCLSAVAFICLLASGLSCSFLSVSLSDQIEVIDFNMTNIAPEDQWYFNELMSEDNNALSVGILCQGDLDWLAPNTADNVMRLLSKVFLIVALVLGGPLLLVTCGISTFLPTSNLVWDGISYIAAGMFVCEMPIFFLLDSPPCNNSRGMFSCELASGSYSLIVSMICSLSLAIFTQWKNPPDWKEEYEIWNLRRMNERMNQHRMNQQRVLMIETPTPEENSNDYKDEEMAIGNQQQLNQRQRSMPLSHDEPAEIGVEIRVEKVEPSQPRPQRSSPANDQIGGVEIRVEKAVPPPPRPQRSSRTNDQKETSQIMGQVIDLNPNPEPQVSSPITQTSPSRSQAPSVDTEVYGSDHGRNVVKEPRTPECQFRAHGMRPVSPLSTCTGLSASPMERPSPVAFPDDFGSSNPNNTTSISVKATFMENETAFMEEEQEDFASKYLVRMPPKVTPTNDDASVHSASKQSVISKQSIVSMMRDKFWRSSSDDGQVQASVLGGDREEVQESWMVEDASISSVEVSIVDKTTPQSVQPQAHLSADLGQSKHAPPSQEPNVIESDTERDIAGLIVPGMISQMKQEIANKPVVSPEKALDPDLDMYPSESSVSELSLPNVEDEEYVKRIEEQYIKLKKSKSAEPILDLPFNYQSDSSGGESELDQVIAGVQRKNRTTTGKITPLNRRARRRRTGGGSVSGDSYNSAQGSLLDEVIVEEGGENTSTEISVASGVIPNMISPEIKSRKSRRPSYDDDDGYQNEQSAEEDDDVQSVTSSVASARRYRLALNRKASVDSDRTPERKTKSSTLEEFLDSDAGVSNEEKVKLLQEALNRLQQKSTTDEGYSSARSEKSQRSLRSLTRVNQRYGPKAETVDLPLNVRNTPYAQDVNTGAAPTSERSRDSAWQARKARLKRLRMLRAEETNDCTDDVIRANHSDVVIASDEGSI